MEPHSSSPPSPDLSRCDREPIHIPGAVQPHGVLFVLQEPDLNILQVSANLPNFFPHAAEDALGSRLEALLPEAQVEQIRLWLGMEKLDTAVPLSIVLEGGEPVRRFHVIAHRTEGGLLLELEPAAPAEAARPAFEANPTMQRAIERLQQAGDVQALCETAAHEVRRITGFDRVKVYRFDTDWHGQVLAEARADHMDSYLGLHFPASDIPEQARRLYTLNRIRIIPDVGYRAAALVPQQNPLTEGPLDLSHSVLRSVSPVHIEYLRNMGVAASMSISIVRDGELWGLIACHHAAPLRVSYGVRMACDLLGQVLALLLSAKQEVEDTAYAAELRSIHARLVKSMVRADGFVEGLVRREGDLLALSGAQGAAIYSEEHCTLLGRTPTEEEVSRLVAWLQQEVEEEVFATETLSRRYAGAEAYREVASGLLSVGLSRMQSLYLLWFRPEVPQTVYWAGDPDKAVTTSDGREMRLHPRTSFATWKSTLRGKALPWSHSEREAVQELRRSIIEVVLVKADELGRLNAVLKQRNRELQDFAYVASHDLQEPLRKIRTFSGLLVADLGERVDETSRHYLERMKEAAAQASRLIRDLLSFSQVTTKTQPFEEVTLGEAVAKALQELQSEIAEADARIEVEEPLPTVEADTEQIVQLVRHLVENAVKFRHPGAAPVVTIRAVLRSSRSLSGQEEVCRLEVEDNGIGFEEKYLDRIFTPFQRLHSRDAYPGTGIGLAVCQRIVERHGGTLSARSTPGEGSTFVVTIPARH